MEQRPTPHSSTKASGDNGTSFVTPKNHKKRPGDILGSGKSQLPITHFYSPLSSSSDRSSQPYSPPIFSSLRKKRRTSADSPLPNKRLRTKTVVHPQKQPIVILSSDESSDEIFTTNVKSCSPAVVPNSRLSNVKRRLYCEASSSISPGYSLSRPKKKLLPKRRSRVLSDSDSDGLVPLAPKPESRVNSDCGSGGAVPMENSQLDVKPLLDVAVQSSQAKQVRRRICLETPSQAVIISSSDDSDFELHNSKPFQSFLSQSICVKDAPQPSHKKCLSSQMKDELVGSFFIRKPLTGNGNLLKKRCSVGNSSDSAPLTSDTKTSTTVDRIDVNILSGRVLGASSSPLVSPNNDGGEASSCDATVKAEWGNDELKVDGKTHLQSILTHNGDDSSIYLQDTIPLLCDSLIEPNSDKSNYPDIRKAHVNSSTKQDVSGNAAHHEPIDSSSCLGGGSTSPSPDDSIYNEKTIDPGMNSDAAFDSDATVDFNDISLSNCMNSTALEKDQNTTHDFSHESLSNGMPAAAVVVNHLGHHSIYNENTIDPGISDTELDSIATVDFNSKPLSNGIKATDLANNTAVDSEVALDWDTTVDFSHESLNNQTPNSTASANRLETSLPGYFQKGAVIEPSDDEDESIIDQNQLGNLQVSKNNRTSLGMIPVSELFDVSHISGSDNSELSDVVHSDDDLMIDEVENPVLPDALSAHMSSLVVEGSEESSAGITSAMNSIMDASADFFSDIVASFEEVGGSEELDQLEDCKKSGKVDIHQDLSPTKQIVNIALDLAGLGTDSNSMDSAASSATIENNGVNALHDDANKSIPEEASMVLSEENSTITPPQPSNTLPVNLVNSVTDPCKDGKDSIAVSSKTVTEGHTDLNLKPEDACVVEEKSLVLRDQTPNGVPAEMKIVCGSQGSSSGTAKIHITQNMEKTLLQNPNTLLLDTIITECQNYAEPVLNQEPIKSFVVQYTNLPQTSKVALHRGLLELLEDSNRWLKYQEPSAGSVNTLVSSGIFEYLNNNDDFVTKLNHLESSEIAYVLSKLGNSPSKSIETMRNCILNKFSSAYTCERVRKEVIDLINRKFVRLTDSALFCIKICLELFVFPLNVCDKLYKTVEIARFANTLIRNTNLTSRCLLLPLKTSKILVNADNVLRDLSGLCRLKSGVFGSALNDESIYSRVNDICSSIAVLDVSAESDPSVKSSPTFRFLVSNYVHALDDQLKTLLCYNTSNIEFGACIYLGVLLQQNVTGFQHKVKWCRERMRYLEKLFDTSNFFDEFIKVLKEPVTPVRFIARSEFVLNALKIKKYGLSLDQKAHLMTLLRPITHKRTQLSYMPLNSYLNYYTVLTKKPKVKNFNMVRANIFENYKSDFPCGIEDNGSLLFNAIFLTFWQVIYQNIEGVFLNKFQNKPLDWGSEEFFLKRKNYIKKFASDIEKHGLPAVLKLVDTIFEQFSFHHCVVDWQLVAPNISKMKSIVETLGLDKFMKLSIYLLEKLDERCLGFPDIILWNPESKAMKFLVLRKPADLYPYQILWLEKLGDFELDAEELQLSGYAGTERCSQLR